MIRQLTAKLFSPGDGLVTDIGVIIDDGNKFNIQFNHTPVIEQHAKMVLGASFYQNIEHYLEVELTRVRDLGEDPIDWLQKNSTDYLYFQSANYEPIDWRRSAFSDLEYQLSLSH